MYNTHTHTHTYIHVYNGTIVYVAICKQGNCCAFMKQNGAVSLLLIDTVCMGVMC